MLELDLIDDAIGHYLRYFVWQRGTLRIVGEQLLYFGQPGKGHFLLEAVEGALTKPERKEFVTHWVHTGGEESVSSVLGIIEWWLFATPCKKKHACEHHRQHV